MIHNVYAGWRVAAVGGLVAFGAVLGGFHASAPAAPVAAAPVARDLSDPAMKEIAMELVSSAENSSLDWRAQYAYIEDIGDGRGYTGGIIGFTSGTSDMLAVVRSYTAAAPGNGLAAYLPALERVDGTASHRGLGSAFEGAWQAAAADPRFRLAQDRERDREYFDPAVAQGRTDGLHALGQFCYYDALVQHGPGDDAESFGGIRAAALKRALPPSQGGDERAYLTAFLDARDRVLDDWKAEKDRVDDAQRRFLAAGNLTLARPLTWSVYGDPYTIP